MSVFFNIESIDFSILIAILKVVAILNKLILLVAHPGTDIVKWMRWRTFS